MDSAVSEQMATPALCSLRVVGDVERATALLSPLLGTLDPEGRYVDVQHSNASSNWNRSALSASPWQEELVVGSSDFLGDLGRLLLSDKPALTGVRDVMQSHTAREWLSGSGNSSANQVSSR